MNETIALPHLAELLAAKTGISLNEAEAFIRHFFAQIENTLAVAESVDIKGMGRFAIDPTCGVSFTPDKELSDYLNQPFEMFSPIEIDDEDDIIDTLSEEENEEPTPQPQPEVSESIVEDTIDIPTHPKDETEPPHETQGTFVSEASNEPGQEEVEPVIIPENESKERSHKHIFGYILTAIVCIALGYFLHAYIITAPSSVPTPYDKIVAETDSIAQEDSTQEDSICISQPIKVDDNIAKPAKIIEEVITDTVTPTRFLTTMARHYYGQMEYWVFIYLANEDKLDNPNRTHPGTVVVIPQKSDFTNDETPEETLARAKRLGREIYARYE